MGKKKGRIKKKITSKWTRRMRKVDGRRRTVWVRKIKGQEQIRLKKP